MAGAQIDASLRRATLLAEARGFIIPDSQPIADPTPQVIIEGDDEEVLLDFDDGLGYTTDKNAYRNYGSTFIWTHNGKVIPSSSAQSISGDLDNVDPGFIPTFNEQTGKYEAKATIGVAAIEIQTPEDRTYPLIPELPFDIEILSVYSDIETGPADVDFPSGTLLNGAALEVDVTGTSGISSYLSIQIVFAYNLRTA